MSILSRRLLVMIGKSCEVGGRLLNNHWKMAKSYPKRFRNNSTIYALSSGQGKAGVAVIRVSGPDAGQVWQRVAKLKTPPLARKALLVTFADVETREKLDRGVLLWFPGPASFTGEECCELHVHGGSAIISAIFATLSKLGFRQAEAGEFTRRAFLNGKLDLTAVEGLVDLIQAETEAQRRQAFRQMNGELHRMYGDWRERIIKAVAHTEAFIDFGEDEQFEDDVLIAVRNEIRRLTEEIEAHLDDDRRGERLRSGVHIVIVGSPNVGKSTLLNYICQRPLAIVSPIPGTTRDVVEGCINFGGYPIVISDTAGLRDSDDAIEHEGIKRALEKARQADLLIVMTDASSLQQQELQSSGVPKVAETLLKDLGFTNVFKPVTQPEISNDDSSGVRKLMMVVNKMDVVNEPWPAWIAKPNGSPKVNAISCLTGFGLKDFSEQLKTEVAELCARPTSEAPSLTQARHRHHLQRCVSSLRSYLEEDHGSDLLLAAHELRRGADQLGKISGDITSEQILDVIFRDFCIGK